VGNRKGARSAVSRVAYLLLHLFRRAEDLGLTNRDSVEFPFFQQHVADALGMSIVHTNKALRRLTTANMVRWKQRKVSSV
jgi:CRP/FNR family transcriptional regulator